MRYKPISILSLVSAALLAATAPAAAAPRRVLVLPFSGSLPDAPSAPARLTEVVARAAGLTGNEVILGKATFGDAATLAGCSDQTAECIAQVAKSLHVDQLVIGSVEQTTAGSVSISLKVFAGGEVTEKVLEFPASDLDTLVDRLARAVPGVFATSGLEPEPARPEPAPEPTPTRPVAPAPSPSPERDDEGFSFGRVGALPWIVTATGVVATGAGTALYLMGRSRQSEVDEAPNGSVEELDRLEALEDEGDRYLKLGSGMMIGGGAVLAGGIILMIVSGSGGSDDDGTSASLAPMLTPGGIGLCLELTR